MKQLHTLCMIVKDSRILLGMKKRGFGKDRWNGFGGKVGPNENVEVAAIREVREEAQIKVEKIEKVGTLEFSFKDKPEVLEVYVYKTETFSGEPVETEEMKPQWFNINKIPYKQMWADDIFWIPIMLKGKKFKGKFLFGEGDVILKKELKELTKNA